MNLTPEQQTILDHVTTTSGLTLIDSVAGSGKTTMLIAIAKALQASNGLYLAYTKSIATEATKKFKKSASCSTTHSLAYQAVVKQYKLKLGSFTYRNIVEKISYDQKLDILDTIREFCLSKHTSLEDYILEHSVSKNTAKYVQSYLDQMNSGKIECTHEFYLKLFHMYLASGEIEYEPFDFIMLDEAGDLNEVTLEIFRLLPSERKIAVGDPFQNIFTFNHTINCFEVLKNEGTMFKMSQSFRVSDEISPRIEAFCQKYLDPTMQFKGVKQLDKTVTTRGYVTRTNSALIARMIELNLDKIPYGLVRKASEIFKLPLMLCGIKYQGFITDPAYKHLQKDIDNWYEDPILRDEYRSVLSYLSSVYSEDFQLNQGIRLVLRHGKSTIMSAYNEAKKHEKANQNYTLATAHSCKGLEFDEVTIASDLNDSLAELLGAMKTGKTLDDLTIQEVESLNLYYVATTRGAKVLNNAQHL